MHIFYDDNMPFAKEVFSTLGTAQEFNHAEIPHLDVSAVDALMIRSTTKVDEHLVERLTQCKYVATATAGYNHLDLEALAKTNKRVYHAAGCNAQAVSEYALSAVLYALLETNKIRLQDPITVLQNLSVGIVGVGQVGSRVAQKFTALGCEIHLYDPPRAKAENNAALNDFSAILDCDIICLHAPLVKTGETPTEHLFDANVLAQLKPEQILLNAGRGEVIDNQALLALYESQAMPTLILDVWEHEPNILSALIPHCLIATPHIAGHSLEGKTRGTFMLYAWLAEQVGQPATLAMSDFLPKCHKAYACHDDVLSVESLTTLVWAVYDIAIDNREFVTEMAQSPCFAELRKAYRNPKFSSTAMVRREFSVLEVTCSSLVTQDILGALGFVTTRLI